MLSAASCLCLLLKSFTKVLTPKRLKYTWKECLICLCNKKRYEEQKENMTTDIFEVIEQRRKAVNKDKTECLVWASRFDKDVYLKVKRYEKKLGKLHHLNRKFYFNNHRL